MSKEIDAADDLRGGIWLIAARSVNACSLGVRCVLGETAVPSRSGGEAGSAFHGLARGQNLQTAAHLVPASMLPRQRPLFERRHAVAAQSTLGEAGDGMRQLTRRRQGLAFIDDPI